MKPSNNEKLYSRLHTKEGINEIYRLMKVREKKTRGFTNIRCVKEENQKVLITEEEIKRKWK